MKWPSPSSTSSTSSTSANTYSSFSSPAQCQRFVHQFILRPLLNNNLSIFTAIGLVSILSILVKFTAPLNGADSPECRMSYMAPAYAKVHGFDQSHTKYALKYSLYLYREQGRDVNPDESNDFLVGIPVLFIPGNAGSYKQIRALAAECSNVFHEQYQSSSHELQPLDFFTADFNEDFTAFHGRTLLDQSEYLNDAIKFILSLYSHDKPSMTNAIPKSVIVVGHSMGGIVARTMITLPNYLNNSINTFITLATPHAAAPVTFDGDLMKVYHSVDTFWRDGFFNSHYNKDNNRAAQRLDQVTLISITGGLMDTVLPADYTAINSLVPETHGFSVFTTGIPGVWTPIDHLAIVWCDQLRKSLAAAMLEILDPKSQWKTAPLKEKLEIFKKHLLPGFDSYSLPSGFSKNTEQLTLGASSSEFQFNIRLKVDNDQISSAMPGERSILISPFDSNHNLNQRSQLSPVMHFFNIPDKSKKSSSEKPNNDFITERFQFNALSSSPFHEISNFKSSSTSTLPMIFLCNSKRSYNNGKPIQNSITIDFTSDTTTKKSLEIYCIDGSQFVRKTPRSQENTMYASESSFSDELDNYYGIQLQDDLLQNFEMIVISEGLKNNRKPENEKEFIIANLIKEMNSKVEVSSSWLKYLLWGVSVELPTNRSLAVDIHFSSIWSSLVAYRLQITEKRKPLTSKAGDIADESDVFSSFIRQYITSTQETKWLVGLQQHPHKLITLHSVAPFVPFEEYSSKNDLHLQYWSDTITNPPQVTLNICVDILLSLRLLVMRFRLVIATLPVAVCGLVLSHQFAIYDSTGNFISFSESLHYFANWKRFLSGCIMLVTLSLLASNNFIQLLLHWIDPIKLDGSFFDSKYDFTLGNSGNQHLKVNPYFIGLQEKYLCFIVPPFFYVIALTLVYVVYLIAILLGESLARLSQLVSLLSQKSKFSRLFLYFINGNSNSGSLNYDSITSETNHNDMDHHSSSSSFSPSSSSNVHRYIGNIGGNNAANYLQVGSNNNNLRNSSPTSTSATCTSSNNNNLSSSAVASLLSSTNLLKSKRRILGTIFVLGSIPFYFPYQFAYVIITVVQATVCIKAVLRVKELSNMDSLNTTNNTTNTPTGLTTMSIPQIMSSASLEKQVYQEHNQHSLQSLQNFKPQNSPYSMNNHNYSGNSLYKKSLEKAINFRNFNISFFLIMLWILPINVPVLIVFIHNFALKWQTPFSSHHNFLAIVPIFIMIERNVSGRLPPRIRNNNNVNLGYSGASTISTKKKRRLSPKIVNSIILGYITFYSLVYGVKHAWWLHYLLNFWCTWLVFVSFDIWGHNSNDGNSCYHLKDSD